MHVITQSCLLLIWLYTLNLVRAEEPVRLVGGTSHCSGILEVKHEGEWRAVSGWSDRGDSDWLLEISSIVCGQQECGSAVLTERTFDSTREPTWVVSSCYDRAEGEFSLRECEIESDSLSSDSSRIKVICTESVRLMNGTSSCSGRVEVKSAQSWVSVCEGDFDQQDAEVVCRELGCGAPSVLQGVLYGDEKGPMWTKEFQCEGNESALLDCGTSDSTRNTCSPAKTVGLTCSESEYARLVGGTNACTGRLEMKHKGELRPMIGYADWTLKSASVVCRQLGCGSAVSTQHIGGSHQPVWRFSSVSCVGSESTLKDCVKKYSDSAHGRQEVICSESVRLVNGTSLCSGRVEVNSDQSWVSVCEGDFDQQDAEVLCRELECGPPSVLRGALYGEVKAPMWTKEFQCEGGESVLQDCRTSNSTRKTCSPDKSVGLTCSEPDDVRLMGGTSECNGRLEMKHQGEWRAVVGDRDWDMKSSSVVCRQLGCGSAVSTKQSSTSPFERVWRTNKACVGSESSLRECVTKSTSHSTIRLDVTCSESVRLVDGTGLCSGRVEVKSDQSWVSVCEGEFDQQDAEVVCREIGCGAPSVLQGALYGEGKAPMWTKEFQCGGSEPVLLDCGTSDSTRNNCSPAKTVGLTCSEPVRLVGGTNNCTGILELKHQGEWRPVDGGFHWNMKSATVVCRQLGCGSAVSTERMSPSRDGYGWGITPTCDGSESSLGECGKNRHVYGGFQVEVTCSESVRLVDGTSLCSGRVEVKSNQSWVSVCEGDFDQQDAEVVCRELGCGAPSVLQGVLYGKVNAPMWTKEFQCEGSESTLLDCGTSDSTRNTCSPDNTVGLTCSEPGDVRLVGGTSKCTGRLEMKHQGEWRPMIGRSERDSDWNLKSSSVVCRQLDCGSAVSTEIISGSTNEPVWRTMSSCVGSESSLKECVIKKSSSSDARLKVICSDSVRLVNGNSLCSGRVEVKSDQSWASVCEGDFDQQDAEVLCREMDCGAPSVLQGALYGESKSPTWNKEFQCKGTESVLQDCATSDSTKNTCSPAKTAGLTCSEPDDVRLVGGNCTGIVEMKHRGEWRPVYSDGPGSSNQKLISVVCRMLGCGSAVSTEMAYLSVEQPQWKVSSSCVGSESSTRECVTKQAEMYFVSWKLICSGPQTSLST